MFRNLKSSSLVGALVLAMMVPIPAYADENATVKAKIQAVDNEFMAALKAGNAERLAGVYTLSGQALPPNAPIITGQKDLQIFWQGALDSGVGSADLKTIELEQFGDSAVQVGQYVLKSKDGNVLDNGKLMILWKKENGEWRWHRDIWNSSRPAS